MAGEWLKLECATPDKPEVFAITAAMGWEDPDMTVGKLFRVWRWFDQHTTNGNAAGVTSALLDRIAGVTGFAQAMINVGWLCVTEAGLSLPNFEKHNGATAKSRAQTAKRVAVSRGKTEGDDACNARTVTQALPREEKKRSKPSADAPGYTPEFEEAWQAYPARPGASKKDAFKAWSARIKEGVTAEQMLKGVRAYAAYVAIKRTEPNYIKLPATFFGPDEHYNANWFATIDGNPVDATVPVWER